MKRIVSVLFVGLIIGVLVFCVNIKGKASLAADEKPAKNKEHGLALKAMQISVKADGKTTVFKLNNSPAARDLYAQLPLSIKVENYSNNEKILYPPEKLSTTDTPRADAQVGTLAYYAPWGEVVSRICQHKIDAVAHKSLEAVAQEPEI